MYNEKINFPYGVPISYEGWQGGNYHLHIHKDVIEILMVLKGKVKLTVSCEKFEMSEGDYAVIRESDSHFFSAAESGCEIVSLYIRMQDYLEKIPYLYYVIFACESFDLAKYRNETAKIRTMIGEIIQNLIRADDESLSEAKKGADHLIWRLVNDYDMVKYYNRKWDAAFNKTEKYYVIMGYIFNHYHLRNIREYISQNEFYSKSYISHLFKEVGASSFKDMLDFVRIFKSDEMLLDSNLSINEISDRCGFSDIKYYTANFKKWYLCTPSEYRKNALQELNKKSIFNSLDSSLIAKRINGLIKEEREDTQYRAAVTPISVKTFGFASRENHEGEPIKRDLDETVYGNLGTSEDKHYFRLRMGTDIIEKSRDELVTYIKSYDNSRFIPLVTIDTREMSDSKLEKVIVKCIEALRVSDIDIQEIYILYHDFDKYTDISKQIAEIKNRYQFDGIKPIFI